MQRTRGEILWIVGENSVSDGQPAERFVMEPGRFGSSSGRRRLHLVIAVVVATLGLVAWVHLTNTRSSVTVDDVIGGIAVAPALAKHRERMYKPQVIQVRESVYVAVGYAISNTIVVEGQTGLIVIDTTESLEAAKEIFSEIRRITSKPVEAIIYTHNHADHIQGTESFFETPDSPPDIWAYYTLMDLNHKTKVIAQKSARGAIHQFGVRLGSQMIDVGIGPRLRTQVTTSCLPPLPNKLIYKEQETVLLSGLNVTFIHVPGETADQMAVWFPQLALLLPADDVYEAFPNLYAIRGTPPRSSLEWMDSLRTMRSLKAEYLIPSHTLPVKGEAAIYDLLTVYMHAIQFIHDQTVRYINLGLHIDEIANRIRLPSTLSLHPYLQEFYGKTSWSAKSVYESYLGWFSGDAAELMPLTPTERARRMTKMIGRNELLSEAEKALDEKEAQWALELSAYVSRIHPEDQLARNLVRRALKMLAAAENNPLARNFYLTTVIDDYGLINWKVDPTEVIKRSNMLPIFNFMKYRLKSELVAGLNLTLVFNLTDANEVYRMSIRHSVLDVENISTTECVDSFDVKLTTTTQTWKKILTRELSPFIAYLFYGDLKIEGSLLTMRRFISYFDREF